MLQRSNRYAADGKDHIWCECNDFGGITVNAINIAADLTSFYLEIPTDLPSQLLKCVLEDRKPNLCFRIIQA